MPMPLARELLVASVAALGLASSPAQAAFSIDLSFSGLTPAQQSYFAAAKSFWEGVITGYQGSVSLGGIAISANGAVIDGVGNVLGSAGPDSLFTTGGFAYVATGEMSFDTADIDNLIVQGSFTDVIRHEMAHVIGFGTMWVPNGVYADGSGRYTGSNALREYRFEFNQPAATFVPVELGGGAGTADGHWNEVNNGGGNTGLRDPLGRDMRFELMTGWLDTPSFVSRTTLASFQDIGYTVALAAVPEPETYALLLAGLGVVVLRARRRA